MPKILLIISLFAINFTAFAATNLKYVPGVSDLPVPINFFLEDGSSSILEYTEGRIITAKFTGNASRNSVAQYYDSTLKSLGWKKLNKLRYHRDEELLTIKTADITNDDFNNISLDFTIIPYKQN